MRHRSPRSVVEPTPGAAPSRSILLEGLSLAWRTSLVSASQSRCATSSRRSPQSSRAWHGHEQEQARGGSCVDTRRDLQRGQARTRRQHGRPRATRSAGLRATQYLAGGKWRGARGKLSLPLREQARVQRDREVVQTTRQRKSPENLELTRVSGLFSFELRLSGNRTSARCFD